MAPVTDSVVDDLKSLVSRLEHRITELENKLTGHASSAPTSQESIRMILMGPPGAGA